MTDHQEPPPLIRAEPLPDGGCRITIDLLPEEAAAIGAEASTLADWFDSALWGLAMARTGRNLRAETERTGPRPATARDWHLVITDVARRLLPRLGGVADAAVREHRAASGSIGDLALALDVARSTAQYRRDALPEHPEQYEAWARGEV